jgi:hypothetical protein
MKDRSSTAKDRIKADQRRGAWWFGFCIVVFFGVWILSKLDLLDIKSHATRDWLILPGLISILYGLKGEVRKLIQEELRDETIG